MLNVNPWNILFTVINLLVLYFGLRHFLYKPVISIMDKRKKLYDDEKAAIDKERQEALALKDEARKKLESVEKEAQTILTNARNHAKDEADRIEAEASFKAKLMLENTRRDCQDEQMRLRRETELEIARLAVMAAKKIVSDPSVIQDDASAYEELVKNA